MELQLARTTLRERIDHLTQLILTSASPSIDEDPVATESIQHVSYHIKSTSFISNSHFRRVYQEVLQLS
jgi:hypothetical protein